MTHGPVSVLLYFLHSLFVEINRNRQIICLSTPRSPTVTALIAGRLFVGTRATTASTWKGRRPEAEVRAAVTRPLDLHLRNAVNYHPTDASHLPPMPPVAGHKPRRSTNVI